jgi:hypothetical protein
VNNFLHHQLPALPQREIDSIIDRGCCQLDIERALENTFLYQQLLGLVYCYDGEDKLLIEIIKYCKKLHMEKKHG